MSAITRQPDGNEDTPTAQLKGSASGSASTTKSPSTKNRRRSTVAASTSAVAATSLVRQGGATRTHVTKFNVDPDFGAAVFP
jgi:hypothetical protein